MKTVDKKRNKYLLKNTAIFAIGNFASKFISFFMTPLYTGCLVASEYGTADLLYTFCNFIIPLLTLNIVEGILRFSLDKNANEKSIVRIACSMVIPLILFGLVSIPILGLFENFRDYVLYFYGYMVTSGMAQIFLVTLKGQEKLKQFSIGNFLHAVFIVVFNLIFLLWLKMGISGYFLAYIISNILVVIYAMIGSRVLANIKGAIFDVELFKRMISYSVVLIPTSFMWWIMNFLDRAMISGMMDTGASGIYAVSYTIPTVLSSISSVFMQAWLFSAVKNNSSKDNERYTNQIFRILAAILVGVSIILLIFIKQFYGIYVAPEYYTAWEYVPVLMIGHIFLTLSTFISTQYNVHKDSKGFLFSASVGAVMNLILNAILIPLIGVQGAAIATTISYMSVFTYRLFNTRKYLKIHIGFKFVILICAAIIAAVSVFLEAPVSIILQVIALIAFAIFGYSDIKVLIGPILRIGERKCSNS